MSKKTAFILMPFADNFSDVYKFLISESLENAGYAVKRADDIKSQKNIIGDIIGGIIDCDLIVADLTGANPNVYYELGIAHALNKKVILITQEIDELPFDLRSYRVIGYSTHFAKMNQAKKDLNDLALEAFNNTLPFGNPVKDFGNIHKKLDVTETTLYSSKTDILTEDLGLFDYSVMLEDGFEEIGRIVTEVGNKLANEVTPEISKSSEKLNSCKRNLKQQKNVITDLAKHLQNYGAFLKPENEKYRLLLKNVETSLENMLGGNLSFEIMTEEAENDLQNFLVILSMVEKSAFEGRQGFISLIDTMESLPKLEKNFNRAKIFMATELKTFIDNIDQTIAVIERAGRLGKSLIEKFHNKI